MCSEAICCHVIFCINAHCLITKQQQPLFVISYVMSLILLNLQSNQLIKLDSENPVIIGRGNVEGCSDKRVSRNHGRVTCTDDGKIRLEALHCNPCFFTRNGVPPVQQLNKNEEETLKEGDYLGLLPNAFWFKITTDKETSIKTEPESEEADSTKTDINCDENARTSVSEENCNATNSKINDTVINEDGCTSSDIQNKDNLNPLPVSTSNPESTSSGPSKGFGTPEFEKTRRLPLWMYEIDEPVKSSKSPNKRVNVNSEDRSKKKQKVSSDTDIKSEPPIKAENEIKTEDEVTRLNVPSTSRVGELPVPASESQCKQETIVQPQGECSKDCTKKEGYESEVNEGNGAPRPICQYEGNCYRKNPQHKLEYCHPGDADYIPYEERPLCQYGAACYRRNERHRVEFRHPPPGSTSHNVSSSSSCSRGSIASSPLPAKRRRKKVKRDNSDYGDDDEYDLDDPFINDASSDEYIPSDCEEEEDLDASREED